MKRTKVLVLGAAALALGAAGWLASGGRASAAEGERHYKIWVDGSVAIHIDCANRTIEACGVHLSHCSDGREIFCAHNVEMAP